MTRENKISKTRVQLEINIKCMPKYLAYLISVNEQRDFAQEALVLLLHDQANVKDYVNVDDEVADYRA